MKKHWIAGCLGLLTLTPSLFAASLQVSTVDNYGRLQTGLGGEFTLNLGTVGAGWGSTWSYYDPVARNQDSIGTPNFQTFCVEGSEYIYPNSTYDVTVGQITMFGGKTLNKGAAWLYAEFAG